MGDSSQAVRLILLHDYVVVNFATFEKLCCVAELNPSSLGSSVSAWDVQFSTSWADNRWQSCAPPSTWLCRQCNFQVPVHGRSLQLQRLKRTIVAKWVASSRLLSSPPRCRK